MKLIKLRTVGKRQDEAKKKGTQKAANQRLLLVVSLLFLTRLILFAMWLIARHEAG